MKKHLRPLLPGRLLAAAVPAALLPVSYTHLDVYKRQHLLGSLLGLRAGVDIKHVPYRGTVPSITDLVGGQIAAAMNPSGDYLQYMKSGKVRVPVSYTHLDVYKRQAMACAPCSRLKWVLPPTRACLLYTSRCV